METANNQIVKGLAALAVGAAVMYWLDPVSGRRRRALATDQTRSLINDVGEMAAKKSRHFRNRASGLVAEARGALKNIRGMAEDATSERQGLESPRREGP